MTCSMKFEVIATPHFRKSLKALIKRHRSMKNDFVAFATSLKENPLQGDELCPGIRKIRMAITSKGRGKSGGTRVITYTVLATEESGTVYLVEIYDKADYSTVDVGILQHLIKDINL